MTKKYLYLNSRDELFRMDSSKVVYFEADGNYTNFVLSDKVKGSVCMNLAEMQKLLTESLKETASMFARVGKRHIVNLTFVYHINVLRQRLVLSDGEVFAYPLNVSKEALKALKEMLVRSVNNNSTTKKQDIKA